MKKLAILLVCAAAFSIGCKSPPSGPAAVPTLTQLPPDTRTVRKVSINKASSFHTKVHGYVWGPGWACPPCPPGATCGTCPEPTVILGDTKVRPDAPVRGTAVYELRVEFKQPPGGALSTGDHLWVEGQVEFQEGKRTLVATQVSRLP